MEKKKRIEIIVSTPPASLNRNLRLRNSKQTHSLIRFVFFCFWINRINTFHYTFMLCVEQRETRHSYVSLFFVFSHGSRWNNTAEKRELFANKTIQFNSFMLKFFFYFSFHWWLIFEVWVDKCANNNYFVIVAFNQIFFFSFLKRIGWAAVIREIKNLNVGWLKRLFRIWLSLLGRF